MQHDHSQNQLQSKNSSNINSSFLIETAPSIGKNVQTPIRESSVTNIVVSNIEIHSDNPTFEENTPHVDTSKFKPDSNDKVQLWMSLVLTGKYWKSFRRNEKKMNILHWQILSHAFGLWWVVHFTWL